MTKFTTTSLIKLLLNFPKDLPIETEIAVMWNYPNELYDKIDSMDSKEYKEFTMNHATDLCIFEGSWDKGNVSNVDGKFEKFQNIINKDESN